MLIMTRVQTVNVIFLCAQSDRVHIARACDAAVYYVPRTREVMCAVRFARNIKRYSKLLFCDIKRKQINEQINFS